MIYYSTVKRGLRVPSKQHTSNIYKPKHTDYVTQSYEYRAENRTKQVGNPSLTLAHFDHLLYDEEPHRRK